MSLTQLGRNDSTVSERQVTFRVSSATQSQLNCKEESEGGKEGGRWIKVRLDTLKSIDRSITLSVDDPKSLTVASSGGGPGATNAGLCWRDRLLSVGYEATIKDTVVTSALWWSAF